MWQQPKKEGESVQCLLTTYEIHINAQSFQEGWDWEQDVENASFPVVQPQKDPPHGIAATVLPAVTERPLDNLNPTSL